MTTRTTLEPPLSENIDFSKDMEEFNQQITEAYRDIAYKVNNKERGFYPLGVEILTSQKVFTSGNTRVYRDVFRKVFEFGAIAAGAALNIAHGIVGFVELTHLYGDCITAVVDYRPVPFNSVVAANQGIQVLLAGANITITNGAAAPNVSSGKIVCEYVKT